MSARTRVRAAAALLAGALLATGCGGDSDPDLPMSWIKDHYPEDPDRSPDYYIDERDTPSIVADEIEGERAAMDRLVSDSMVFLRYDNHLVAIEPRTAPDHGSRIDVDTYASGRSRYSSYVGSHWPAAQSRSGSDFRGGGPGSGK
ncbi:DUF4247 domain-containing protein [Streptomyces sp. MS19]|uniref:DUF4247 domain-containing protein n=1 Tax=Streptomyces sp. MS19 TaxID=3385972 RepID=UPI0039A0035E